MNNYSDHELLRRYLNGSITAPEEAELERRALADPALADGMLGLRAVPEADHAARVASMLRRARAADNGEKGSGLARAQVPEKDKGAEGTVARRRLLPRWAAAAAILLLVASSIFLVPDFLGNDKDVAMSTEAAAPAAPREEQKSAPSPSAEEVVTADAPPPTAAPEPDPTPSPNRERPRVSTTPASRPSAPALSPAPAPPPATTSSIPPAPAGEEELVEMDLSALEESVELDDAAVAREDQMRAEAEREVLRRSSAEQRKRTSAPPPLVAPPPPPPAPAQSFDPAGQTRYLEGIVTNENGVPIRDAQLTLPGQPIGEKTDSNGYFRLPATAASSLVEVTHPDYETDEVELSPRATDVQISLDRKPYQRPEPEIYNPSPGVTIDLNNRLPGFARPAEGFANLRERLEEEAPADLPRGRYKFSFLVNTDGTLTDFSFRGSPPRPVMDYIGTAMVQTSAWEVVAGEEPVRIYFKVVLR